MRIDLLDAYGIFGISTYFPGPGCRIYNTSRSRFYSPPSQRKRNDLNDFVKWTIIIKKFRFPRFVTLNGPAKSVVTS